MKRNLFLRWRLPLLKKKASRDGQSHSQVKESQRPPKDPFEIAPYKSPLDRDAPDPRKPEAKCPNCKAEVGSEETTCRNCGSSLKGSWTGEFTNYGPDKPVIRPPKKPMNIVLNEETLYDSRKKRFVTAVHHSEDEPFDKEFDPDAIEKIREKANEFDDIKVRKLHITDDNKDIQDPACTQNRKIVDIDQEEIDKSCTDLAIDG